MAKQNEAPVVPMFHFDGYKGDGQPYGSVFIDPETDPLNDAGVEALAAYRRDVKPDAKELEVRLYIPFPREGIEKFIDPTFLAAWKTEWKTWAEKKGVKTEFNPSLWLLGNIRIAVIRDRLSPWAYKQFTIAGVKLNPKKVKKEKARKETETKVVSL